MLNRLILDCIGCHTSLKRTKFAGPLVPWMKELDHNLITEKIHSTNKTLHVRKTGPIFRTLETSQKRKQMMRKTSFYKKFLTPKHVKEILKRAHRMLNPSEKILKTDTN